MTKRSLLVSFREGVHAKPSTALSNLALEYQSEIKLFKNEDSLHVADVKNQVSLIGLGILRGDIITVTADGIDEKNAIDKITELIECGFKI